MEPKNWTFAVTPAAIRALAGFGTAQPPLDVPAPEPKGKNLDVTGTTPENCLRIAVAAETQRTALAKLWLGKKLADWPTPCPVEVTVSRAAAGGMTTFAFERGSSEPALVAITGSLDRILSN